MANVEAWMVDGQKIEQVGVLFGQLNALWHRVLRQIEDRDAPKPKYINITS